MSGRAAHLRHVSHEPEAALKYPRHVLAPLGLEAHAEEARPACRPRAPRAGGCPPAAGLVDVLSGAPEFELPGRPSYRGALYRRSSGRPPPRPSRSGEPLEQRLDAALAVNLGRGSSVREAEPPCSVPMRQPRAASPRHQHRGQLVATDDGYACVAGAGHANRWLDTACPGGRALWGEAGRRGIPALVACHRRRAPRRAPVGG